MSRPLARVLGLLLLVVALWLPAVTEGHAAPTYPALTARIVDEAGLLGSADEAELTRLLEALETASTDQLVVATVSSLQGYPIEEFAHGLAQHWQLGQKGKDNGVLLLVAPNERAVRIEVGRRLEPMLPDGLAGSIIRSRILPSFRRGDFAAGIKAGVTDIRDVLLGDVEAVKQRAAGGRTEGEIDPAAMLFLIVWLLFLALFIWQFVRAVRNTPAGAARGRIRRGPDIVVIPGPGGWGGSGGWSGGGGSRGGGWSGGGGGSFGGGGASGRW